MHLSLTRFRQLVSETVLPAHLAAPWTLEQSRPVAPVTWPERAVRFGQEPVTLLLTGPARSGKSTIVRALERRLFDGGRAVAVLDDDWAVSPDSFGPRRERAFAAAFRRAIAAAKLLNDAGLIAIYACSAPTIEGRRRARQALEPSRLLEIHLAESPAGLRRRDEMPAYEPPSCPDLTLPTYLWRVSSCVDAILKHLQKHRVLR